MRFVIISYLQMERWKYGVVYSQTILCMVQHLTGCKM